jgi:hypothetical protein
VYGYVIGPIRRRFRQGVGDIDVGVSVRLFDRIGGNPWSLDDEPGRGVRQTIGFTYRLGTGTALDPDDPFALATGDGQDDLEVMSATDIMLTSHVWGSVVARWTKQLPFDGIARIPDATGSPFIPLSRRRLARTEPGDRLAIQVAPRYALNSYFAIGGLYRWTRAFGGSVTEQFPEGDAQALQHEWPSATAHEAGIGVTWSSVAAWRRRRARWPLEVQWDRSMVVAGSNGVARFTVDRISVRAYVRLWGAGRP